MQITDNSIKQINTVLTQLTNELKAVKDSTASVSTLGQGTTTGNAADEDALNNMIVAPSFGNVSITMQQQGQIEIQLLKKYTTDNNFTIANDVFDSSAWFSPQYDYAQVKNTSEWFANNWMNLTNYTYNYFDYPSAWHSGAQSLIIRGPNITFNLPYDIKIIQSTGNSKYREIVETFYYLRYRNPARTEWKPAIEFSISPIQTNIINNFETTIIGGENSYIQIEQGNDAGIPEGIYTNSNLYFTQDATGIRDTNGTLLFGKENEQILVRATDGTNVITDKDAHFNSINNDNGITTNWIYTNGIARSNSAEINSTNTELPRAMDVYNALASLKLSVS